MQHSEHGASSAHRWVNCPGSVRRSRGLPDTESIYAKEGTAAHKLAEMALSSPQLDVATWFGTEIKGVVVDEEMVDAVEMFRSEVMQQMISALSPEEPKLFLERRFTLDSLNPPAPMYGTADAVVYHPSTSILHVNDFKYGKGIAVDVVDNYQLMYYALGALLWFEQEYPDVLVRNISMCIVQPRAAHADGPIRKHTISYADLLAFTSDLMDAALRTMESDAPLVVGSWCRFCRAQAVCPAMRDHAQSVAQVEFSNLPADVPPEPDTLPIEVLLDVMQGMDVLEGWMKSVRAFVRGKLEHGDFVPGWKLIDKRANRKWRDEDDVIRFAEDQGLTQEETHERKLLSPAKLEKVVKKYGGESVPEELWHKTPSGTNLVPESHPSPAKLLGAGEEFVSDKGLEDLI